MTLSCGHDEIPGAGSGSFRVAGIFPEGFSQARRIPSRQGRTLSKQPGNRTRLLVRWASFGRNSFIRRSARGGRARRRAAIVSPSGRTSQVTAVADRSTGRRTRRDVSRHGGFSYVHPVLPDFFQVELREYTDGD
jgi:hypothetical protein